MKKFNRLLFMNYPLLVIALCIWSGSFAQQPGGSKTIDITSSFKPSLIPPKKIVPNASPATGNASRSVQPYDIPVQQLSFKYAPSSLKPLAYSDTTILDDSKGYLKAGYGNFATPYLKGALNFGSGETTNGNIEGYYTSSEGKLPFQKFTYYGAKANAIFQLNENHSIQARAGFGGQNLFRYGYKPDTIEFPKDSLKLNYNDVHIGATVGNSQSNEYGLYYKAQLDGHFFTDNHNGNETALHFDLPLEKQLGDNVSFDVGLKGVLSNVKTGDTSFSNNMTIVKAGARFKLTENTHLTAALLPSWNNGDFNLLPQVELEAYLPEKDYVLQTGLVGSYVENTWRNLVAFNPWMEQPNHLTHSRNIEFYVALKGNIDENWFFRIKGSYQRRNDVPLYINDSKDGKTFQVLWEPSLNISGAKGELVWKQGDWLSWSNQLTIQGFSGLENASKAYGLLPFEFNSSLRAKVMNKLVTKVDFYHFAPTWRLNSGKAEKGDGGLDLNVGAEFDLVNKVKLWIQFNNVFNNTYQRWNQYPVLGFQALGGVIVHF